MAQLIPFYSCEWCVNLLAIMRLSSVAEWHCNKICGQSPGRQAASVDWSGVNQQIVMCGVIEGESSSYAFERKL